MRRTIGIAVLVLAAACSSAPEPAPLPVAAPAPPPPDPRIAEMQILLNELIDRLEVINARLQRLESGAPAPVSRPASVEAPREPAQTPARAQSSPPARRSVTPPTPAVLGDQYREALTLFGKGRIDDARGAFEAIFEADPGGDLADNSLYWMGETHFVQGRYTEAIDIYRRIVAEYPGENRAPDALLKIGLAQAKLGDLVLARGTFETLIERYPYSTPAATARHEIERIKY